MKKMLALVLALAFVFVFSGVGLANNFPIITYYIPSSLNQPSGFPVMIQGEYVVYVDKEELDGWHTTCIGSSFVDKHPKSTPVAVVPPRVVVPPKVVPKVVPPVVPRVPPVPPVVKKSKPILEPIYFDSNKSNITPNAAKTLDKNGVVLKENPSIKVEVGGHTDSKGPDATNKIISEKRANSASKYLQDKFSIQSDRLKVKGYGESKPCCDNKTEEGRKQNRRVEFQIE